MKFLHLLLRQFSLLSIDVGLGAVSSAIFFHHLFYKTTLPLHHLIVLFFAVTALYSFDHIADILRIGLANLSERRKLHALNFPQLILGMILSSVIVAFFVFTLPLRVVFSGIVISIFISVYFMFILILSKSALKDLGVSLGYTAGIVIPVWAIHQPDFSIQFCIPVMLFLLNTLFIMLTYAVSDTDSNEQEHIGDSISRMNPQKKTKFILISGFIYCISILLSGLFLNDLATYSVFSLQIVMMMIAFWFKPNSEQIRWIGEYSYLLFFIPFLN